jgi:LysR family transcriptional regulator, low CO2-responsive transcriptional regulator
MDLGRLSTDALASFAVFAEHLNFTRSAEELRISQPALHVKVNKLAESLGRPLYRRQGRALTLTREGEAVARFARELDGRVAAFLAEVRGTGSTRPLVLAAGEGAYLYLLGDVVRDLLRGRDDPRRPPLKLINCDRARMLGAVRTGRADLGVGVLETLPDDLHTTLLATYPATLVMPEDHPLAARRRLTLADLDGRALVLPPPNRPHRVTVERALRDAQVDWVLAIEAEGWPLTLHFVSLGVGLAVVNGCVRPTPGLVSREIAGFPAVPYYAAHLPDRAEDPRIGSILAAVRR